MKTTIEYLDSVKEKHNMPSDYALAKHLGVVTSSIIAYRNGRSAMGIEVSMKVGELLGIDGHAVYADGQIERAKNSAQSEFWKEISEKFAEKAERIAEEVEKISESFKRLLSGCSPHKA